MKILKINNSSPKHVALFQDYLVSEHPDMMEHPSSKVQVHRIYASLQ
ncbi:hypothetical protein [Desulforhopalus sp. 52FAK]